MLDGPEPDHAASALSGQSALVSSHPDIQIGNARKYIELLHSRPISNDRHDANRSLIAFPNY